MNLLKKVKAIPMIGRNFKHKQQFTDEERMEVAIAWLNDDVTISQIQKALEKSGSSTAYTHIALGLKYALRNGYITTSKSIGKQS